MASQEYSTRPIVPISVRTSKEHSVTEVMEMNQGYSNPPFSSSPQLLHPTTSNLWWRDPQNELVPPDILPSEITPFRRKDTMTLAALGHIPGPLIEEHNLLYRSHQDEEVIKYPRMDSESSPVSRPVYSQHSLDLHSPKPRIAAGTQLMFQNIIGYSEPVPPVRSAMYSTHETRFSGLSDTNINGPRVSDDAHSYGVRHSGQSQGVCGYCEDSACKYADTYICAMADTQRRSAQSQELYDALDGMWRDMRAQRTNKASKPWCPRFS